MNRSIVAVLLAAGALVWLALIMLLQWVDISRNTRGVLIGVITLAYVVGALAVAWAKRRSN